MNAPDKETKIAQNKKHHHKGDTSIIQETPFKENPEDTKSIEFVNTHTTNCNDSMTPSREQDTHDCFIEQGSNYNATKDQEKFYTHEISPQNIHNDCVQQDSNSLATKHLKIISEEDSFASEQDPSYSNTNDYSRNIFSQRMHLIML